MKDKSAEAMEAALEKSQENDVATTEAIGPMPEPEIKEYVPMFKLEEKFVDDVNKILGEFPYSQSQAILKAIDANKERIQVKLLEQIIQAIAQFPYRAVKPIMEIVESKNQSLYWNPVE